MTIPSDRNVTSFYVPSEVNKLIGFNLPGGVSKQQLNHVISLTEQKTFLDYLPLFKEGLEGNEMQVLLAGINAMDLSREGVNILDIGSADGDWLKKASGMIRDTFQVHTTKFTALEPVIDNPGLKRFCENNDVRWEANRIEESRLEEQTCLRNLARHIEPAFPRASSICCVTSAEDDDSSAPLHPGPLETRSFRDSLS